MPLNLTIALISFSVILFIVTTIILKKGRMPEKYSLLWYFISLVIFVVAVFPNTFSFITSKIGFQTMSNMIIGIILVLLTFLTMALTIIISGQKKKATLLIQEISILKHKVGEIENDK